MGAINCLKVIEHCLGSSSLKIESKLLQKVYCLGHKGLSKKCTSDKDIKR